MKPGTLKIILTIFLPVLSLLFFFIIFPTIGLYLCCITTVVLFGMYFNLKRWKQILISVVIFCLTWLLLIDKAFEFQGRKIAGTLIEYSNSNKMPDGNYLQSKLYFNSFTPIFTHYHYGLKKNNPRNIEDIVLSYVDICGHTLIYCDADGEFENRMPSN